MVSVNKVLTRMGYEELLDYSCFTKEPQKVMQRGLMHVGETGVKIVDNLAISINDQPKMDKYLMELAYSKFKPIEEQIKLGDSIVNSFNFIRKNIRNDVSRVYAKYDLNKMVNFHQSYSKSNIELAQAKLVKAHQSKMDYPGGIRYDKKAEALASDYNKALDSYYNSVAHSMLLRDTLNEIVGAHKNRPLNKFAKLFGI